MQARTVGSGGGSNQNTRRQERDPSSAICPKRTKAEAKHATKEHPGFRDLAKTKKPDTLPIGKMPG